MGMTLVAWWFLLLSIKRSNFHICFCSFDLSCSILDNFVVNLYIFLSCLIAFFFNVVCFDLYYQNSQLECSEDVVGVCKPTVPV